ncbi:MAG: sigma-70 family RNA polymerase sigma factor [Syntrophomonadaceae bacterium]|nr:sigma-70 family RNA polymerase sigma factor [Syntrophomonadaceae bacterium]
MKNVDHVSDMRIKDDNVAEIFTHYYYKLYKYTIYRVGDHDTTEDLVSEVFEKVVAKYSTYNPRKAKLSTWLYAIANNTIINYHKKKHACDPINPEYKRFGRSIEESVIENETREYLLKALMQLDERSRNVIALKFGAGITNREIAQMLDLTETNVGTILYRSLRHLREELIDSGIFN